MVVMETSFIRYNHSIVITMKSLPLFINNIQGLNSRLTPHRMINKRLLQKILIIQTGFEMTRFFLYQLCNNCNPLQSPFRQYFFPDIQSQKLYYQKRMTYLYSFYNSFNFYPQALYPLYSQPDSQNTLQPLYFTNSQTSLLQTASPEQFEAILISGPKSCKVQATPSQRSRVQGQNKQNKRVRAISKDENFGWRNQNKQRNVISSIFKKYVNHILHERGMVKLIEELLLKVQGDNDVSKFYEFMGRKFPAQKTYVGLRYIRQIIAKQSTQNPVTSIFSITLRRYLKQIYPLEIIRSSKLGKKIRLAFLKKARSILSMLFI